MPLDGCFYLVLRLWRDAGSTGGLGRVRGGFKLRRRLRRAPEGKLGGENTFWVDSN